MTVSTLRWPLFALIGLLVAVAVALLANRLVSERIGISSEPVTAGESLSPKQAHRVHQRHRGSEPPAQTTSTGSGYTGTVSGDAGSGDAHSGPSQADDSKPAGGLGTTPPAAQSPAPSTGSGSDSSTEREPGDD